MSSNIMQQNKGTYIKLLLLRTKPKKMDLKIQKRVLRVPIKKNLLTPKVYHSQETGGPFLEIIRMKRLI